MTSYNQAIKYAPNGRRTAYSLREQSAVYGRRWGCRISPHHFNYQVEVAQNESSKGHWQRNAFCCLYFEQIMTKCRGLSYSTTRLYINECGYFAVMKIKMEIVMVLFKNYILHACFCIFFIFFISSCASQPTKKSDLVKQNAKLAIEDCGKGNVKEVTINGYECSKFDI